MPVFDSVSYRRELGVELTEAGGQGNRKPHAIQSRLHARAADTFLIGKITAENKKLLFEIPTGDPREMEVNLTVQVSWTDQRGRPVCNIPKVPVPGAAVNVSATSGWCPKSGSRSPHSTRMPSSGWRSRSLI